MSKVLRLTVRERKQGGESTFEGVAQLEGGTSFKLTKSRSTETRFSTQSSLKQSASNFAKRYGLELNIDSMANKPTTAKSTSSKAGTKSGKARTKAKKSQPSSLASDSVIV